MKEAGKVTVWRDLETVIRLTSRAVATPPIRCEQIRVAHRGIARHYVRARSRQAWGGYEPSSYKCHVGGAVVRFPVLSPLMSDMGG